jgi:hypothetical protein
MNTTIETTTQPIKETWIKLGFEIPNKYSTEPTKLNTGRNDDNNPIIEELKSIKNMCVSEPMAYAETYGKSLLSLIKEMFPESRKHRLEVWSKDLERHAEAKAMFEKLQNVTGFRGNIKPFACNNGHGYNSVNYGESNNQNDGVEAGKGTEIASTMEPLD